MSPDSVHLVVATPCHGGLLTQRYMPSVFGLMLAAANEGAQVSVDLLGNDSLITRSRYRL